MTESMPSPVPALREQASAGERELLNWLRKLPAPVQALPLARLHLAIATHHALAKAHITTVGELLWSHLPTCELPADLRAEINPMLVHLLCALNKENEAQWFAFWEQQAIELLPPLAEPDAPMEQLVGAIPLIVQRILYQELHPRAWTIIERRFGLDHPERLTVEQISRMLHLTQERTRQHEEQALAVLRDVFVHQSYAGRRYHVHPAVHRLVEALWDMLATEPGMLLLESRVLQRVGHLFALHAQTTRPSLSLLLTLHGFKRITFDCPLAQPVWGCARPDERSALEEGMRLVARLLTQETARALTTPEILAYLQQGSHQAAGWQALTETKLHRLIDLCGFVERREDGSIQAHFAYLKGRGNQAERPLSESGHPLHLRDIAHELEQWHPNRGRSRRLTQQNLGRQLVADCRFCAIGRSGQWGLRAWPHLETSSIAALME